MALARVVTFEGVSKARMDELNQQMQEGDPPEGLNPSEMVVLHDADGEKAVVILFFDSEEEYARGDEVLNAMASEDTPGQRTSVGKYDVAARMTP